MGALFTVPWTLTSIFVVLPIQHLMQIINSISLVQVVVSYVIS